MQHNDSDDTGKLNNVDEIAFELKGNTLLVYWLLLRQNRPHRAREIQRLVGLSSSSLALHHLAKLIELDLVTTDSEGYYIIKRKVRPGLLSMFVGAGYLFIPRFVFYGAFNTALLLSCTYIFGWQIDSTILLLILILLINCLIFWAESIRIWKLQPL
ncbi:MAG: winged helix-turn-helix domain-containing protein [Promethearchaeota archaeon]